MMTSPHSFRRTALAVSLAISAMTAAPITVLAGSPAPQQLNRQAIQNFNISAGSLNDALNQFTAQSGLLLSGSGSLTNNKTANAVQGKLTASQALDQLLIGTGLSFRFVDERTVIIEQQETTTLPGVTVSATSIKDLPDVYAGGQVATGSQLGMLGDTSFIDAPFNITSYTANLIESQQARSLANILDNDPSVQVGSRGRGTNTGGDAFSIRGFSLLNSDVSFQGLYGVLPANTVSMETVERVEVIKGPNALLNGTSPGGRVGGTINIVPKRATDTPITRLTTTYNSDSQLGTHIDVGRRFGDDNQFGARFNGVFREGDVAVDDQTSRLGVANLGLDFRGERWRLSTDMGYQNDRTRRGSGFGSGLQVLDNVEIPAAPDTSNRTAQTWESIEHEDKYAVLQGELDINSRWTLYGGIGGREHTRINLRTNHALIDNAGTLASFPVYYPESSDTKTAMAGLRGQFDTAGISHRLNLNVSTLNEEGGYLYESDGIQLSQLNNVGSIAKPIHFDMSTNIPKTFGRNLSSVALADTLGLFDERLLVTLGMSYQQVEVENFDVVTGARTSRYSESVVTPAVGVTFKPWQHIAFYSNYIEGLDLGYTAPATAENAGESFEPSKTKQLEAGVKVDMGTIGGSVSVFEIRQPSVISKVGSTSSAFISTLDGEQRNRGVELNVFGELAPDWRLLGGVMYLQPKLTKTQDGVNDDNYAAATPRWLANLSLEWDTPFVPGMTLNARVVGSSSQYTNASNTKQISGWSRWDLGASYQLQSQPVLLRASVENVFDRDYWESASGSGGRLRLAESRMVSLSATIDF